MAQDSPAVDLITEAKRLLSAAGAVDLPLRLIGGLAVRLHIPPGVAPVFEREYNDIDLVTLRGQGNCYVTRSRSTSLPQGARGSAIAAAARILARSPSANGQSP